MLAHFIGAGSDQVGERSNGQAPSAWGFRKLQSLTMSWLVLGTFGPAGDLPLRRKLMPGDLCKKSLSSCSARKPYARTPLLFGRLEIWHPGRCLEFQLIACKNRGALD